MNPFLRWHRKAVCHIVNMTDEPFRMYEDYSGKIMTFFPIIRRFCTPRTGELFPTDACYVLEPDDVTEVNWLRRNHRLVAFIGEKNKGRDGIEIVRLVSPDCPDDIRFCKK